MSTPQKKPVTPQEIERRMANDPRPTPPLELLDEIQQEIPDHLDQIGSGVHAGGPRRQTWLIAATLATVVLGGFLAWRLGELNRWSVEPSRTGTSSTQDLEAAQDDSNRELVASDAGAADLPGEHGTEVKINESQESLPLEVTVASDPSESQPGDVGRSGRLDEVRDQQSQPAAKAVSGPSDEKRQEAQIHRELEGLASSSTDSRARTVVSEQEQVFVDNSPALLQSSQEHVILEEVESSARRKITPSPAAPPSTGGTREPNDQPYGDMFFKGYGTNPFLDPEEDRLSTFGLDVDTGSYTLARSYLERGNLPPAEAVRVEEFLNYFDYHDPAPRSGDFALSAEGAPSPFAGHEGYYLLRFGVQGREIAAHRRPPATLIFVVDVSGSMNRENRLGLVKRSLTMLLDQLNHEDQVGLVVYGSRGQVLLEPTRDHGRIRSAIGRLHAGGSTNAEEGLMLAYDLAREFHREGGNHRIILCSDGVANVGRTGPESILGRIRREADEGIELTTVGFGMGNYNDVLMEQLADQGDGRYAYVDDLGEARRLFVEELTGTLQTIAADAKAQVEFNPEVIDRYRLIGYENRDIADERFRDDTVDAGEIGAGHHVTALYEIKLREGVSQRRELATLRLRYHSKRADRVIEEALPMRVRDLESSMGSAAPSLQLAALVAEFGEIFKGSYWAKDGDLDRVLRGARELASKTRDPKIAEFRDLVQTAVRLQESAPQGSNWIEE